MFTEHRIYIKDGAEAKELDDESVDLVVTSPPYPMISMWDDLFARLDGKIGRALNCDDGREAFELMHACLDRVWDELHRVIKPGAFACINIGDAVRTLGGRFQLYVNHSRIQQKMSELGFDSLPLILWRKQTNSPNKFMGSGMLPAGAYVTLEHEYILIFRKGGKRVFRTAEEKARRMESALFWEERNVWYSDLWDFKGVKQETGRIAGELRSRSAAFPLMLPFRLINMYSQLGDLVLDPFFGTGTTSLAAMACGRNSAGYELEGEFVRVFGEKLGEQVHLLREYNCRRIAHHLAFVEERTAQKGTLKYVNDYFNFPVMTNQEKKLKLVFLKSVKAVEENCYLAEYMDEERARQQGDQAGLRINAATDASSVQQQVFPD